MLQAAGNALSMDKSKVSSLDIHSSHAVPWADSLRALGNGDYASFVSFGMSRDKVLSFKARPGSLRVVSSGRLPH